MIFTNSDSKSPLEYRKLFLYYLLFSFMFLFLQLILTSVFTFFHFLLEHDMNTIESWLSRNTWEVLILSKFMSFIFTIKILKLNIYEDFKVFEYYRDILTRPSRKIWGMTFFILFFIYILIEQFSGGVDQNQFQNGLLYSSYLGSTTYYLFDILLIVTIQRYFNLEKINLKLYGSLLLVFLLSSKIALPYMSKFIVFIIIHFIALLFFAAKKNSGDVLVYIFLIIGPLSSVFGLDIVWDNLYSVFAYDKALPVTGILGIWCIAIGYYQISRSH